MSSDSVLYCGPPRESYLRELTDDTENVRPSNVCALELLLGFDDRIKCLLCGLNDVKEEEEMTKMFLPNSLVDDNRMVFVEINSWRALYFFEANFLFFPSPSSSRRFLVLSLRGYQHFYSKAGEHGKKSLKA